MAAHMNYVTAYLRVKKGMTIEQALSTPVKIRRGGRKAHTQQERCASAQRKAAVKKERYAERHARIYPDHTPKHIQLARAEYCMKFMRGEIDQKTLTTLKDYANECRATREHLSRVPDEHAPRRYGRETATVRDNSSRDDDQIDEGAAGNMGSFLRA
jgi:hypothetical protein